MYNFIFRSFTVYDAVNDVFERSRANTEFLSFVLAQMIITGFFRVLKLYFFLFCRISGG